MPEYRTESVEEICALAGPDRLPPSNADCSVGPGAQLPAGFAVLEAWGFTYRSQLVWVKEGAPGTGWWCRGAHENMPDRRSRRADLSGVRRTPALVVRGAEGAPEQPQA